MLLRFGDLLLRFLTVGSRDLYADGLVSGFGAGKILGYGKLPSICSNHVGSLRWMTKKQRTD